MAKARRRRGRPATTPEAREHQVVSLAYDLAEKQLTEGSASSQVITHFLKMGSNRARLEEQRLANENRLIEEKVQSLASARRVEELYTEALEAMRSYAGQDEPEDELDR